MPPRLFLKKGKEKPLLSRHPWVFSGAVERREECPDGDTVDICATDGAFLARGYLNTKSQIIARAWTWDAEPVDTEFLARRLEAAIRLRLALGLRFAPDLAAVTTAFRLVNAESDLLPGLVVDVYGEFVVLQALTLGIARRLPEIVALLADRLKPRGIYQRSDVEVRAKEGLALETGVLYGDAPPETVLVHEHGLFFKVDVRGGQKTGFFLDQRENRRKFADSLAGFAQGENGGKLPEILNAFSYTGGFGVYAARACPGATIVNLDASEDALRLARQNFDLNASSALPNIEKLGTPEFLTGNAFEVLRKFRDQARQFEAIVLDPPKLAQAQAQVPGACRGYKDLNLLAIKLLRPGGLLFTFSCSGLVTPELFQKVVAGAAADARRDVQILARLGSGPDHPVLASFPEGEYLKGLALRCV